jgi:phosphohistidine phosphatase
LIKAGKMLHLLLLRHAKAEAAGKGMSDRDRPLTARGRRDAGLIGEAIATEPPDSILCSPAKRTRETLAAVVAHFDEDPTTDFPESLYEAASDYRDAIVASGGDAKRLLIIGHNPTIHRTALTLTGTGDAALHAMLSGKFPTAALAVIAFDVASWKDITPGSGELLDFRRPKDLGAFDADD